MLDIYSVEPAIPRVWNEPLMCIEGYHAAEFTVTRKSDSTPLDYCAAHLAEAFADTKRGLEAVARLRLWLSPELYVPQMESAPPE